MKQSPIFVRTYDLLRWLMPVTIKFPRTHRFVMATNLQTTALQLQDELITAAKQRNPRSALEQADIELTKLRTNLRLAHDLGLLKKGQYHHVAAMINEIGRLLGGWMKRV